MWGIDVVIKYRVNTELCASRNEQRLRRFKFTKAILTLIV